MQLFSENELLIMTIIIGTLLVFLIILTILDVKEKIKNHKKKNMEDESLMEELPINNNKNNEVLIDNNIEIIDDEPLIKQVMVSSVINEVSNDLNNVSYEPIKKDYKEELEKVKIELEDNKNNPTNDNNIDDLLYKFEMEQEENAIISYDELSKISNNLYDSNENIQYDDGNEPITIDEVLKKFNNKEDNINTLSNVPSDDLNVSNEISAKKEVPIYMEHEHIPFISSIYGYEKNNLSFENTATYDKLSIENEDFLTKLKEVHDKND